MPVENNIFDGDLRIRVNQNEFNTFMKNSIKVTGKPYQVLLREFIKAFNEKRLRIIPTEDEKTSLKSLGELYNVTGK